MDSWQSQKLSENQKQLFELRGYHKAFKKQVDNRFALKNTIGTEPKLQCRKVDAKRSIIV